MTSYNTRLYDSLTQYLQQQKIKFLSNSKNSPYLWKSRRHLCDTRSASYEPYETSSHTIILYL